jgi:hypothetical protein
MRPIMSKKQKIIVEFELEIFETEGERELVAFDPVSIDTADTPHEHLSCLLQYLRHGEDAAFDINWELKGLLNEKLD